MTAMEENPGTVGTSHPEFGKATTATEVAAALSSTIRGKNVIITGVGPNSLGEATALAIASGGPGLLILTARDPAKAQAVANKLKAQSPQVSVRVVVQDLASFASVRKAAAEVNAMPENIDLLINNAGVMSVPERTLSVDGYEMHFAVNHLGHFLFTNLILGKLLAAAKAPNAKPGATRVINLTGNWHNMSPVRFSDINFTTACVPDDEKPNVSMLSNMGVDCTNRAYIPEAAYGQSKSANILFCLYIKRKLAKQGINAVALNPGGILTNIGRHYGEERVQQIIKSGILNKNPDQGSATTLVAAFDPALNGGEALYLMDCQPTKPGAHASNMEIASRLWKFSEDCVGQEFPLGA